MIDAKQSAEWRALMAAVFVEPDGVYFSSTVGLGGYYQVMSKAFKALPLLLDEVERLQKEPDHAYEALKQAYLKLQEKYQVKRKDVCKWKRTAGELEVPV